MVDGGGTTGPAEFLGLTSDYWQAIATFASPVIAGILLAFLGVKLGGRRLRKELQGQDVRHQFLDQGLTKLSNSLEEMLGAIRLNYGVCLYLLKVWRDVDTNHPAAPRPEDLPMLVPVLTDPTAFAAIGPASRIANCARLGDLATHALTTLFNFNLWLLTEVWLPVRGSYSGDKSSASIDLAAAVEKLTEVATSKYYEAEAFAVLPRLLSDLALRTMEIGLDGFDDFWHVRKDKEVLRLRDELNALLDKLAPEQSS
jgi:hypothetical protein